MRRLGACAAAMFGIAALDTRVRKWSAKCGASARDMLPGTRRSEFVVSKSAYQLGKRRLGHADYGMVCGKRHISWGNAACDIPNCERLNKTRPLTHLRELKTVFGLCELLHTAVNLA